MSCVTCGHTMQGVGEVPAVGGSPIFWCPRCGTLATVDDGLGTLNYETPKLVERCRQFAADPLLPLLAVSGTVGRLWNRLGIAESINTAANRPV